MYFCVGIYMYIEKKASEIKSHARWKIKIEKFQVLHYSCMPSAYAIHDIKFKNKREHSPVTPTLIFTLLLLLFDVITSLNMTYS